MNSELTSEKWTSQTLRLPVALRVVTVLIACAIGVRYFGMGVFSPAPVVIIVVLVVLSIMYGYWPRVSAAVAGLLSVLVPVSVLLGYLQGAAPLGLLLFDTVLFVYVLVCSLLVFRGTAQQQS